MPIIQPFEENTGKYESWFDDFPYVYESELIAIKQILPRGSGLEVGIGTGRFAFPLGIKQGIEPSPKMKAIAISKGLDVIDGTGENIPHPDSSFDFVLMVTTICFLDDPDKTLQEIRRVLKPDGSVIIAFVDKESPLGRIYLENKEKDPFYKPATFYSTAEVLKLVKDNGFHETLTIQTIFGNLNEIKNIQKPKVGFKEGAFVIIKAQKE